MEAQRLTGIYVSENSAGSDNIHTSVLTVTASQEYNGARIQCIAHIGIEQEIFSDVAVLEVQGEQIAI